MQRHSAIFYPRFWGVIYKYIITSYIFQFKHNSKVLIESIIIFISPPMFQDYNIKRTENNSLSRPAGEWGGLTAFWPTLSCLLCLTAPDPRAHEVLGGQSSEVKAICQARVKLLQTVEATFFSVWALNNVYHCLFTRPAQSLCNEMWKEMYQIWTFKATVFIVVLFLNDWIYILHFLENLSGGTLLQQWDLVNDVQGF